ncbi:MAG: hypothetical protein L3K01_01200 [Thermoplasmata archaeon]|nr:hypothetical protein [Thermoplasmata archaeon]
MGRPEPPKAGGAISGRISSARSPASGTRDSLRRGAPVGVRGFAAIAAAIAIVGGLLLLGLPAGPVPGGLAPVGSTDPPAHRVPAPPGVPPVGNSSSSSSPATSCNRVTTPTPSSILVPLPGPTGTLAAGGSLGVAFEFSVANSSPASSGATVDVPSVFATFPLQSGGSASVYLPPHSFPVAGSGWLNGSRSTGSTPTVNALAFASNGSALLSSQKIAVLANTPYGALTLQVRWQWTVTSPNGSTTTGAWSVPTASSGWPTSVPSIFEPAPVVTRVSETGPNGTIGTNFTAQLGGNVSGRYFFLELEAASTGKVTQSHGETAPVGATAANVTIVLLNYDRYLYPGNYLVHIHDACGALLLSLPVKATYAASATLTVYVQPASCGPVTFQGTTYGNDRSFSVTPSSTPYSVSVPVCSGHPFKGWHFSGGVYLASATKLLVSSSGTFTVLYS